VYNSPSCAANGALRSLLVAGGMAGLMLLGTIIP
jgi:hypothetical protein